MNIEFVRWLDSGTHLHDGWMQLEVVKQQAPACLQEVETVGHVVYEDDDVIVLGLSVDSANETVFGAQVIAKSCIRARGRVLVEFQCPSHDPNSGPGSDQCMTCGKYATVGAA